MAAALPIPGGRRAALPRFVPDDSQRDRRVYKAGVPIEAGTDAMPGFTLDRRTRARRGRRHSRAAVLQLATIGAAALHEHDTVIGSIAPGKLADMILVDGDPTVRNQRHSPRRPRDEKRRHLRPSASGSGHRVKPAAVAARCGGPGYYSERPPRLRIAARRPSEPRRCQFQHLTRLCTPLARASPWLGLPCRKTP